MATVLEIAVGALLGGVFLVAFARASMAWTGRYKDQPDNSYAKGAWIAARVSSWVGLRLALLGVGMITIVAGIRAAL